MKWNQGKETGQTLLGKQGGRDDVSKLVSVDESESLFEDTLTKDLFIDKKGLQLNCHNCSNKLKVFK